MKTGIEFKRAGMAMFLLLTVMAVCDMQAADPRERTYYYEILKPSHEDKARVSGFATERVREALDRGLVAVASQVDSDEKRASGTEPASGIYLSWRLLESDVPEVAFDVYREVNGKSKKLNRKPITQTTDFVDVSPAGSGAVYTVVALDKRGRVQDKASVSVLKPEAQMHYRSIKLNHSSLRAGKVGVADLNGDGVYDYIVRTPDSNVDPGMPGDLQGRTYQIEAYLSDGTFLWSKDLGQGIEPGIWYSPYVVYDFNGDGKAEVALKTAPDNVQRDEKGRVDTGDEYLSVLDGMTGKEMARVDWPERNFRYGNLIRRNRNQIGMAFLDGKTPYILACRGTYKLMVVDAWQLEGTTLTRAWRWDGDEENPVVRSQGAHNMVSGDVDGDGRDEVLLGSCMLDDNGTLLWSAGLGHPDKAYLTDIDPRRPGMEVFLALEPRHDNGRGVCMVDAKTGEQIWNIGHTTLHVGDGMVADFDTAHLGLECFASEDRKGGSSDKYLLTSDGQLIGKNEQVPPCRDWAWWDADLLRETFVRAPKADGRGFSVGIGKWQGDIITEDIQGSVLMIADLYGDWREEIVTSLPGEIRIYTTGIPARDRRVTLMQDPIYRNYIAHRSMGYPQAPVPSYYLGLGE